jgi:hypothetical protein
VLLVVEYLLTEDIKINKITREERRNLELFSKHKSKARISIKEKLRKILFQPTLFILKKRSENKNKINKRFIKIYL